MRQLAFYLSYDLGRPVATSTGLAGTYDIMLDFLGDPATGAVPAPRRPGAVRWWSAVCSGRKLFGGVHHNSGLIGGNEDIVEVLVIDRIEQRCHRTCSVAMS